MAAVGAALLAVAKVLGIVLLAALALLLLALVLPASVWIEYREGQLGVKLGFFALRYTLLPAPKRKPGRKKKPEAKPKKQPEQPEGGKPDGSALAQLTLEQICAAAAGAGRFFRGVLGALRVQHIRLFWPVHAPEAADTALQYGKMQAWLHSGLAVLDRYIWLGFDECRIEPDFTGKCGQTAYFSCQVSAQLIIIGIAAVRFALVLYHAKLLDLLLDKAGRQTAPPAANNVKEKQNG